MMTITYRFFRRAVHGTTWQEVDSNAFAGLLSAKENYEKTVQTMASERAMKLYGSHVWTITTGLEPSAPVRSSDH